MKDRDSISAETPAAARRGGTGISRRSIFRVPKTPALNAIAACTLAVLFAGAGIARAQAPGDKPDKDKTEKPEKPSRKVRFLTLGDAPPFMQEVRNGVRYELDPPPGSIPPREIVPGFGEKEKDDKNKDEKEKPGPVKLSLGRMSNPSKIPDGAGPLELRKKDTSPDSKPWVTVQRPEHGDLLVLLWRDPRGKTWDLVDALVLPDGGDAVAPGGVMFLNLVNTPIAAVAGPDKFPLPFGRTILKKPAPNQELPVEVYALNTDGKTAGKRYLSTAVPLRETEFTRVLVYRADGESPRAPVEVLLLREPLKAEQQ